MEWDEPSPDGRGSDHRLARAVAAAAGALLLEIRMRLGNGASVAEIRSEGDRRSHELILAMLERAAGDPVLSEEGHDAGRPTAGRRLWIVDPLDGTREFGELGRDDWAVHVALCEDGRLVAGAVALPARGAVYGTDAPPPLPAPAPRRPRIAVSRTRPPAEARQMAERIGGDLVPMGSAGAKTIAVVTGEVDAYVHAGGQYVWDSAAPVAVAAAAGLHASRIDGSPLSYGDGAWLPDLLVCRPGDRDRLLTAVASSAAG